MRGLRLRDENSISINEFFKRNNCEKFIKYEREAIPAKPEKEWYREASEKQYSKCLHQKGL